MIAKYIPKVAKLTDKEKLFLANKKLSDVMRIANTDEDTKEQLANEPVDFIIDTDKMLGKRKVYWERDKDYNNSTGIDFDILYRFSATARATHGYGQKGFSHRLLYEFLCENYNGGEYFIDTYFKEIFPYSFTYTKFQMLKRNVEKAIRQHNKSNRYTIRDKKGRFAELNLANKKNLMMGNKNTGYTTVDSVTRQMLKQRSKTLCYEIKEHIIDCLASGLIPLNFTPSINTIWIRQKKGITSKQGFYATGEMVRHIMIYAKIDL